MAQLLLCAIEGLSRFDLLILELIALFLHQDQSVLDLGELRGCGRELFLGLAERALRFTEGLCGFGLLTFELTALGLRLIQLCHCCGEL